MPCADTSFGLYVGAYVRTAPLCRTARLFTDANFPTNENCWLERHICVSSKNCGLRQKLGTRAPQWLDEGEQAKGATTTMCAT